MTSFLVKTRKIPKSRAIFTTIALMLLLTLTSVFAAFPLTSAHTPPYNIPTYAYVLAAPNPAGVNQPVDIVMWIDKLEPAAAGIGGGRWQNYTITITKPDGTVLPPIGPLTADPTSTTYTLYVPTQVGKYNVLFNFGGGIAALANPINGVNGTNSAYIGDYFMPSQASTSFTVQQQASPGPVTYPLPTGYWTRPVNGLLTSWAPLVSNWLYTPPAVVDNVQPFGSAPNSQHIMWTKPVQFGGVVGGSFTSAATKFGSQPGSGYTFYEGMSYEERNISPIIISGKLFYELPLSDQATGGGYVSVDLQTGQQEWMQNYSVNPTFGQLYGYDTINQHGVIPNGYLWAVSGSTWIAYDAITGNWLFNLTNVPSGTTAYGSTGEILRLTLGSNAKWLTEWNNTNAPNELLGNSGANALEWRPVGKVINASTAYDWNLTLPANIPAGSSILQAIPGYLVLIASPLVQNTGIQYLGYGTNPYTIWAISINPATLGQTLWTRDYPAPSGNVTRSFNWADPSTNMFIMYDKETLSYWGFSLTDGHQVWGPFTLPNALAYFQHSAVSDGVIANGNLYAAGWGGLVFSINDTTGKVNWVYGNGGAGNSTDSGSLTPYGYYPTFIGAVADGKVYVYNSEHSPIEPPYQGEKLRCLDANTGQELWTLNAWPVSTSFYSYMGAVADGYLTFFNEYDGQMYSIGKGPSATTVDAPMSGVTAGSVITIKGTVTDQSAGAKDSPAISDKDMGSWMTYKYMQMSLPTNVTGVPVAITAIASDKTVYNIGTVTSDIGGSYGISWTPPSADTYQIIAKFAGTNSYGDSYATTYVAVGKAPSASPNVTPTPSTTTAPTATPIVSPSISPSQAPQPTAGIPVTTYIAISAAVVIIVVVAAALVLRKRK